MVARFFRNNDKLGFVLLPVAAIAAWLFAMILPGFKTIRFDNSFIFFLAANNLSFGFIAGINLLCLITGAYLVSFLCIKQEITDKQNLIPGFVFILFSSLLTINSSLHPAIIANLFLIGSFHRIFSTYREELSLSAAFDSAFLLGIAALFYTPFSAFFIIPFIGLLILKPFKIKEWVLVIMGLILPFLLSLALLFLFNKPVLLLKEITMASFVPFHKFTFSKGAFLIHSIAILLFALGLLNSFIKSGNAKIKTQKIKSVLVWFVLFGVVAIFFLNETIFFFGILLIVPAAIFVGDYLGTIKNNALREFLTLLLLGAFVCSNLQVAGLL
ncbi:MAG: DUF6427 family protein [Bacteroidota bacterium]|nr:DUF6427 family protein [Bacteroidota bacterium]